LGPPAFLSVFFDRPVFVEEIGFRNTIKGRRERPFIAAVGRTASPSPRRSGPRN